MECVNLICTCQETFSYANLIRFKLVAGLIDEKIKEETLKTAVDAKESARRAKVTLGGGSSGQVSKVDQVMHNAQSLRQV